MSSVENFQRFLAWCESEDAAGRKMEAEGEMTLGRVVEHANASGYDCLAEEIGESVGKAELLEEMTMKMVKVGSRARREWQ